MSVRRININIRDGISDELALGMVRWVVAEGRISNSGLQYCYLTAFPRGHVVVSDITKAGHDSFTVYKEDA
jgi:hypothetical protein